MASEKIDVDRADMVPFLLRLFYRTGSMHSTSEFISQPSLPAHLTIYTWTNCTLRELSSHLFSTSGSSSLLPSPALGARLVFRLVYPDAKAVANANAPANFITRDIGSVVLGHDRPGVADYDTIMNGEDPYDYTNDRDHDFRDDDMDIDTDMLDGASNRDMDMGTNAEVEARLGGGNMGSLGRGPAVHDDGDVTLQDAKFVIGDYVTVTILLPGADGAVPDAPPISRPHPPPRGLLSLDSRLPKGMGMGKGGSGPGSGFGFGGGDPSLGPGGRRGRRGRGGGRNREVNSFSGSNTIPIGEWRRGERIPDPPRGGGGGGRRGKRW